MLSRYKAVFFDVGGTLLRVHPSVGEVYAMHARSFGFHGSGDELDERFRCVWEESGGVESLGHQSNEAAERRFWRDIVFRVFEPYDGLRNFENYFERVYTAFCGKDHWRIFEDVVESGIFDKLKKKRGCAGSHFQLGFTSSHHSEKYGPRQTFRFYPGFGRGGVDQAGRKDFCRGA